MEHICNFVQDTFYLLLVTTNLSFTSSSRYIIKAVLVIQVPLSIACLMKHNLILGQVKNIIQDKDNNLISVVHLVMSFWINTS